MRYYWNDKEVSEEEYQRLDLEWKRSVEDAEAAEKNSESSKTGSRKKSGNQKIG